MSYDTIPLIAQASSTQSSYANAQAAYNNTYANESTFPFPAPSNFPSCSGATNGACNTRNILAFYSVYTTNYTTSCSVSSSCVISSGATNPNFYAAGLCKQTIAGYSDWYLPAICEMGYGSNCGTLSVPTLQNIQKSLIDSSGFSAPAGEYWSSTEFSLGPQGGAWGMVFSTSGGSNQSDGKNNQRGVRCSRAF